MNTFDRGNQPHRDVWEPGKLWSLWDMLEVMGGPFVRALDGLRDVTEIARNTPEYAVPSNVTFWSESLGTQLANMGCRQTLKRLRTAVSILSAPTGATQNVRATLFESHMKEVWSRLCDELEDQKLYCITEREAEALRPVSEVYGSQVAVKFNALIFDLEEASKAIAFGRGTAAVFHLMRAIEGAVAQAGEVLNVTVVDKYDRGLEWGKIISNMKTPIEAMDKADPRKADWSEVQTLLFHVKDAWRNTTMHPKQTYTLEEAAEVLAAVRAFLRRLAPLV
jgi:hypothetical protein